MTKRIIDSMTADQIITGWDSSQKDVAEYIESICKPTPNWEDDVSDENPILCWVSNESIPESGGDPFNRGTDRVFKITKEGYMGSRGHRWQYARPISSDEIWQPAENLASPLEADRLEELLGLASKLDEICAALEDLIYDEPPGYYSGREQYIYNGAVHDAIQVVKNTEPGES